jgi:molybdopterin molybdotransferase
MSAPTSQAGAAPPRYAEAIERVLEHVMPTSDAETLPLDQCDRRVLVEAVVADRDLPSFDRAQMDGYALRADEFAPGRRFPVAGTIAAGHDGELAIPPGACVAIATGAPLPPGVNTVIQHEKSDRANPVSFTIDAIEPGHAVHPCAADARKGDTVIAPLTLLASHHLGIAAAVGRTSLRIARRPRAVVLTSGDEIVSPDAAPETHQVRNSNASMLIAMLKRMGAETIVHQHVPDEFNAVRSAVTTGLKATDMLITVGGISAGERDHFRTAFDEAGVEPIISRVQLQPGGPIYVGKMGHSTLVVGLPGNPVSVLACACLFVWPIVQRAMGLDGSLPWRLVELAAMVKPNPVRQAYRPACLGPVGRATVPTWAGSGDLVHTATTDGLVELPVQSDAVEPGTVLRFLPWP